MELKIKRKVKVCIGFALSAFYLAGCDSGIPEVPSTTPDVVEKYRIHGSLTGLEGNNLVLKLNENESLKLTENGGFSFSSELPDFSEYSVTVHESPEEPLQECSVINGSWNIAGEDVSNLEVQCEVLTFPVSGSVSGLNNNVVVLQNNEGDLLVVGENGEFTFDEPVEHLSNYSVTVRSQPTEPSQTCLVTNGEGKVPGAPVTDIQVSCSTNAYKVAGTLSGLTGDQLVVSKNDSEQLVLSENGPFEFQQAVRDLGGYTVSIVENPDSPTQICSIANGSGAVSGQNVSNISITCSTEAYTIDGEVSGLEGSGLVLQNNNSDDLELQSNGVFSFSTKVPDLGEYHLTVKTQPVDPVQACVLNNGDGQVEGGSPTGIEVVCQTNEFDIGGSIQGLEGQGLVLQINNGEELTIAESGEFRFGTQLPDKTEYQVDIKSLPSSPNQSCEVTNGSGTVNAKVVSNIQVACSTNSYSIGGQVSGLNGTGLSITNNEADTLELTEDGRFEFPAKLLDGSAFDVAISGQPTSPSQECRVSNGSGSLSGSNVEDITIQCRNTYNVGVTVDGLASGNQVVLLNNGEDSLSISENGQANFPTKVRHQDDYLVTIDTNPAEPTQTCEVLDGSGTVDDADVVGIEVYCSLVAPTVSITPAPIKKLHLEWALIDGATSYRVLENVDGISGYSEVASLEASVHSYEHTVLLPQSVNSSYVVQACNDRGCTDSVANYPEGNLISAIGYIKASNTGESDIFGASIAVSHDGTTMAIGAPGEDSGSKGINGNQSNDDASGSGAVYMFSHTDDGWLQTDYIKASNADGGDSFGQSVALSDDGDTMVIGAYDERSKSKGVNGDQTDNSLYRAGAAYVFKRSDGVWIQTDYIKASNTHSHAHFGEAVSISGDGLTIAIGAEREKGESSGINGNDQNTGGDSTGAVYVFKSSSDSWEQSAYIKASNPDSLDYFGSVLSLNEDGTTLAVGAFWEDSSTQGINGDQSNDSSFRSGAVYVFQETNELWTQQAYIKSLNSDSGDYFGVDLDLSASGNVLAVGAPREESSATGINGDKDDNSLTGSGAVYLFSRSGSMWAQEYYLKPSVSVKSNFGFGVAIAGSGDRLVVTARYDRSESSGMNADPETSEQLNTSGAAYLFIKTGDTWEQESYFKASNPGLADYFGSVVEISSDGSMIAIGTTREDSAGTGVGAPQDSNAAESSGAVYLY